ncbi:hypothetical protein E0493_22750 [Roseomonas sp. M0104]|uniref:MerR family transcriptional regulator n=1 Tax=Teichococcus coralli TaxID=2545983 RepID=A0A845BGD4_9PROT|nr:hypothetical protein [Pseudoroseomonas coralli]MXP66151.1 hypothetical protein [Pseudoroseomonas coralli]
MKLPDLIARVAGQLEHAPERVTPRFVRFLISQGVIDGPGGSRAQPAYSEAQAQGILDYLRLRDLGVPLEEARAILRGAPAGRFKAALGPGLLLIVDPASLGPSPDPQAAAAQLIQTLETLLSARKDAADAP